MSFVLFYLIVSYGEFLINPCSVYWDIWAKSTYVCSICLLLWFFFSVLSNFWSTTIAIFCLLFEEKSPKDISNTILLHTKLLFQCFLPYIEKILMISLQITENPDFIQPRNLTEISFEFDKFAKFNIYCQKFSTSPVFCVLFEENSKKDIWNNIFLRSYFFSVFHPRFKTYWGLLFKSQKIPTLDSPEISFEFVKFVNSFTKVQISAFYWTKYLYLRRNSKNSSENLHPII